MLYTEISTRQREREREKRKELNKIKTALLKILEFSIVHNKTNLALLWSLSVGRRSLRSWFLHPQLSRIPTPRSRFLAATWNQRRDLWAANFLPPNRYTCKSKHATQWKSHTRARARFPSFFPQLVDRWRNYWLHTSRGADVSRFSIENFLRHIEISLLYVIHFPSYRSNVR